MLKSPRQNYAWDMRMAWNGANEVDENPNERYYGQRWWWDTWGNADNELGHKLGSNFDPKWIVTTEGDMANTQSVKCGDTFLLRERHRKEIKMERIYWDETNISRIYKEISQRNFKDLRNSILNNFLLDILTVLVMFALRAILVFGEVVISWGTN